MLRCWSPGRHIRWVILTLACVGLTTGCRTVTAPDWKALTQLRAAVGLAGTSARTEAWQRWGDENLESGDLLFVHGESRIFLGLVDFSRLASDLADSPFSHVAIVSREDDQLWVYDIVAEGPRRIAFADFIVDRRLFLLAAKRLRSEHRQHIPPAIRFCRHAWQQQQPFDDDFRLDNDRWYCSELIEIAFRQSGLPLSEPVPIDQLPGYARVAPAVRHLVLSARSIDPTEPVFLPGNDAIGIWASPSLQPLLEPTDLHAPPSDPMITTP
jgi:hypothetical protein